MTACLILLGALVIVGILLRAFHRPEKDTAPDTTAAQYPSETNITADEECCGMHAVCEKVNTARLAPVEYYDDEELDRFAGRESGAYTHEETEEFRDILYTLLPTDVAGWGTSLEMRGIMIPDGLRDEYLLLLSDNAAVEVAR